MNALDSFYLQQPKPIKSTLLALREIILKQDSAITNEWKYGMPFFCYKSKMFCYLWVHKALGQPYIGLVEGKHFSEPFLLQEKRSRMKIMLIDPNEDLPLQQIETILEAAINLYRTGVIKIRG
jgi:hypothetical protein